MRGEDPRALAREAATPDERLPYLAPALRRLLEELPGTRDGLGRTERQLLEAVAAGARTRGDAFLASMAAEEAPFMGDTIAFDRLAGLDGLVHGNGSLQLTDDGEAVLGGRRRPRRAARLRPLDRRPARPRRGPAVALGSRARPTSAGP